MYLADAASEPNLVAEVVSLLQLGAVAFFNGWAAERVLDSGLGIRGLTLFCGIGGLHAGTWLWALGGWPSGPVVAGQGLAPAFVGALAVTGVFKLIGLGVSGVRR